MFPHDYNRMTVLSSFEIFLTMMEVRHAFTNVVARKRDSNSLSIQGPTPSLFCQCRFA